MLRVPEQRWIAVEPCLVCPFALLFSTWGLSGKEHACACKRQIAVIGGRECEGGFKNHCSTPKHFSICVSDLHVICKAQYCDCGHISWPRFCGNMQDALPCASLHPRHLSDQTPAMMTHLCQDAVCADFSIYSKAANNTLKRIRTKSTNEYSWTSWVGMLYNMGVG